MFTSNYIYATYRISICRSKKEIEVEILHHIERCTKIVNHNMINTEAFILAQAEKEDVDLEKYKTKILTDIQGMNLLNICTNYV